MDGTPLPDTKKPRGLRALYAWMLEKSQGRNAWWALAAFAFAEASFFPIPPDVMLLPMMLADRRRAFRLAAWCAFWSVMGGMLGYAIGAVFWDTLGLWLIGVLHIPLAKVEAYRQSFSTHAYMIAVQGITPIPYKLVTIASGLAGVPFAAFMFFSTLVRTFRFVLLEGTLVHFFGAQAKELLDKYLEVTLIVFLLAVVLGVVAVAYL